MEIEYQHQPEVFKSKILFQQNFEFKKDVFRQKCYFFIGIALLVFGIFLVFSKEFFGFVIMTAAVFLIWIPAYYLKSIKNNQKVLLNEINAVSQKYAKNNTPILLRLEKDSDFFYYKDLYLEVKIFYDDIKRVALINEILFLQCEEDLASALTFSKEEVGAENFQKLVEFFKLKFPENFQKFPI